MDKHIEALSKPVAWTDADELADMDSNTHGNIFNAKYIDIHNGRWLPLYSQEYVGSLLSQLEAAQKGMDDFQRSCDRHHKVSVGLNERLIASEAALSAANEKPKPISFDELADRVQFVTGGIRMSFAPLNCKGHQIVPFMNFNSLSRIVEMYRTTETYHLAGFTVEGE
ncbi:hypothetical protein ABF231_000591 [Yersinia ruckeri]|uniref:hypothetical protein n=1 Tax=Yersinia ruckeri TaxID=29486 RepID=UPI003205FB07|nr:hypothetical protein [Yersinia ruckeri]